MNEHDRLAALLEMEILDTPHEKEYDDLVRLASTICGTPIGLVSLVDQDRQWFKASIGLEATETHRDLSFCAHAIQQSDLFVVEDAARDARFLANGLVTGDPHIRFYAGMPLQAPTGASLGTLCVIDTVPRRLTQDQADALIILARQVQARMELRLKQRSLEQRQQALESALHHNRQLCARLEETNELFQSFMNHGPFASYIKDADGSMIFYNKYLARASGVSEREWIGLKDHEIWPPELASKFRKDDLVVLEGGVPVETDDVSPAQDGSLVFWKNIKFPYRAGDGVCRLAGISIDVTREVTREAELENVLREKSQLASQLEILATTDFLTGLSTRRVFAGQAALEYAGWKRRREPVSMLILDVDNFKKRNDQFGHAAGDEALALVGKLLLSCIRQGDVAARMGGEEFGVILPHTGLEGALELAERFQRKLREHDHGMLPLTVSIGASSATDTSSSWEMLLSQADQAMYAAKRSGKDRVIAYSKSVANLVYMPREIAQTA